MASIYSTLDTGKHEIKVLKIDDSKLNSSVIRCTLITVSLDDQPEYTALSYCWGIPHPPGEIVVNGTPWGVTPNLAAALAHLRRTKDAEATPIWIDALCINQDDLEERSAQVAMMTSIYAQAQCVHLWLGEEIGPSSDAMMTLEEFFNGREAGDVAMDWCQQSPEYVAEKLSHLVQIGQNPYWRRMWILQEVSFASDVIMHARDKRVDMRPARIYSGMMRLDGILREVSTTINSAFASYKPLDVSNELRRHVLGLALSVKHTLGVILRVHWSRTIELVNNQARIEGDVGAGAFDVSPTDLFVMYRKMLSSDPKDKIYGLLGFVADFRGMQPDYTNSVREIYCSATLLLMWRTNDLSYLNQACPNDPELPSWVPDYSKPCLWERLAVVDRSGWAASSASARFDMIDDGSLLVRELLFDKVKCVKHQSSVDPTDEISLQQEWTSWLSFHPALLSKATNTSGQPSTRFAKLYEYVQLGEDNEQNKRCRDWLVSLSGTSEQTPSEFTATIARLVNDYELFASDKDYFGIAPKGMVTPRDSLGIIAGARVPFCVTTHPLDGGRAKIRLKAPTVLDGDVVGHETRIEYAEWSKHAALA